VEHVERTVVKGRQVYKTRTGAELLQKMFEALVPDMYDLIDIPQELRRVGRTMRSLIEGEWAPDFEGMTLLEQAYFAIPLMNTFRLEAVAFKASGKDPAEFYPRVDKIFGVLAQIHPGVAWVAIRNSMAWESCNRKSTGGKSFGGMGLICEMKLVKCNLFMEVFLKIRQYHKESVS
jgi:hypothetical protein